MRKLSLLLFSLLSLSVLSGCVHHSVRYAEVDLYPRHVSHETVIVKSRPHYHPDLHVSKTIVVKDRHHAKELYRDRYKHYDRYRKYDRYDSYQKPVKKVVYKEKRVKKVYHKDERKHYKDYRKDRVSKHGHDSRFEQHSRKKPAPVRDYKGNHQADNRSHKNYHQSKYEDRKRYNKQQHAQKQYSQKHVVKESNKHKNQDKKRKQNDKVVAQKDRRY